MSEITLELSSITYRYKKTSFLRRIISKEDDTNIILDNISMAICQSQIYGLLGASGCGKTTLLRLILGRLIPLSGSIRVLGHEINDKSASHLENIGYMPQDVVLYDEFSAFEMLQYFGQLYRMPNHKCLERINELLKLLQLDGGGHDCSHRNQLIKHLSGGQRRRVSLAIALLHDPEILILDEPTVGVDPLLRESIWKHLKFLTTTKHRTVLLTTHYIEETRHANLIGFLRCGRLLVQDHPHRLLRRFCVDTMEAAFLKLCHYHDNQQQLIIVSRSPSILSSINTEDNNDNKLAKKTTSNTEAMIEIIHSIDNQIGDQEKNRNLITLMNSVKNNRIAPNELRRRQRQRIQNYNHNVCLLHIWTLVQKNFRQVYRNWSLLLFFILLPAFEMALIMLCIGRDINHIPIAIYNGENPKPDLSQVFLDSFAPNAFILINFDNPEQAYDAVKNNQAAAVLQFNKRFSEALRSRFFSFGYIENDDDDDDDETNQLSIWDDSSVYVQLDMSNQLIALQIQRQLLTAFLNFAQRLAVSMGLSNHTFRPPIAFGPPVYGIQQSPVAVVETFIAPGALIMIAFFATTIVSCHLLIHEIRQQLIERALIAGATTAEFLLSHMLIQSNILMVQLFLVFVTAFYLFGMPYLGSLPLSISLICLQGLCGLMYGLMLSATCPDEIYATTLSIGTFFPSVIIGGIFWPVQSMPTILQYVSQCLPSTQSIDALRYILLREWNLKHSSVAFAFIVSTIWLMIFTACALTNFKRRV